MRVELPLPPSSDISKMTKLRSLWTEFQLSDIETEVIKVSRRFDNFDDFDDLIIIDNFIFFDNS